MIIVLLHWMTSRINKYGTNKTRATILFTVIACLALAVLDYYTLQYVLYTPISLDNLPSALMSIRMVNLVIDSVFVIVFTIALIWGTIEAIIDHFDTKI